MKDSRKFILKFFFNNKYSNLFLNSSLMWKKLLLYVKVDGACFDWKMSNLT